MGINDSILKIERKFAWSFFGFLLALIFGGFSIYTVYFKDANPKLDFIIETNTKVLDLRENVRKLDIIYKGENIKESGKNLSIIKVRIQNTSTVNILSGFYDLRDSLGFKLENAEIVEKPELTDASNDYLRHNIKFNIDNAGNLKFSPVIIEGGESFVLKILALHKTNDTPILRPFGKIAGIKEFHVIETFKSNTTRSFWSEIFEGSFLIHLARFIAYIIVLLVALAAVIFPLAMITDALDSKKKNTDIKKYKEINNLTEDRNRNLIFRFYSDGDLSELLRLKTTLSNESRLASNLKKYLSKNKMTKYVKGRGEATYLGDI